MPARPRSPYEVLGVTTNASQEEISAAYRRLAQQYHPDKVAGLGREFGELAEQKMKAIKAAYAVLQAR
ncbi:MAG: DnaJ domain-containing protein [Chloroflexota bacterium]